MNAPQPAKDGRRSILELNKLISETRAFFHDLEEVSRIILARHGLSPQERRLLMTLRKHRRCTVPQLARKREVSRQYVQVTMNDLAERGLVAFHTNPDHKRSRLLELTGVGEELIRAVMTREGEALQQVAAGLSPGEAREAVAVLHKARQGLAGAAG
ncbi:MAG: MarR family winged helix-turn-helix transcriptional regulator [Candidatus Krumholzibacteriota bacterium]